MTVKTDTNDQQHTTTDPVVAMKLKKAEKALKHSKELGKKMKHDKEQSDKKSITQPTENKEHRSAPEPSKPKVVVDGKELVALDTKPYGEWIRSKEGREILGNKYWSVGVTAEIDLFSHFKTTLYGVELDLLVDSYSEVTLETPTDVPFLNVSKRKGSAVVVNSVVNRCEFEGENYLLNVEVNDCVVNKSSVARTRSTELRPIDELIDFPKRADVFKRGVDQRARYNDCRFIESEIKDSPINGKGLVKESYVDRTHITAGKFAIVKSHLTTTTLTASMLSLSKAYLHGCYLSVSETLILRNFTLRNKTLYMRSLYAPNKLGLTEIELPFHPQNLILHRTSKTQYVISIRSGGSSGLELGSDVTWEELSEKLGELLIKTPMVNNEISEDGLLFKSILNYVLKSVISRMKIIKLMDDVMAVNRSITSDFEDPESVPYC